MKKLNVTRKHFNESKYFTRKYGNLAFVSESGKLFKTDKGKILKFNESGNYDYSIVEDWIKRARTAVVDARVGLMDKRSKEILLDDAIECLDLLESAFNDSKNNLQGTMFHIDNFPREQPTPDEQVAPQLNKGEVLMFKEDHAKGEHLYSIVIKDLEGWEASFRVNAMNDEEAEKKARTHMKDGEEILHIYDIGEYKAFDADDYAEFDESGSDKSEWFDERGELVKPLPGKCIEDCSDSGRVDDQVAYWVNALKFDLGLPRERAINFLSEYGAWELDELDGMDDFNLAEKVLWIFCGDIKEEAYEQARDETSLVYDWGDVSDWDDEDWKKFQEEYSYCSLNS